MATDRPTTQLRITAITSEEAVSYDSIRQAEESFARLVVRALVADYRRATEDEEGGDDGTRE